MIDGPEEVSAGEEWFAVRCVLRIADLNLYEERITLWRTDSFEDAIALAEAEVEEHARIVQSERSSQSRAAAREVSCAMAGASVRAHTPHGRESAGRERR
jgi:hypothetical protein